MLEWKWDCLAWGAKPVLIIRPQSRTSSEGSGFSGPKEPGKQAGERQVPGGGQALRKAGSVVPRHRLKGPAGRSQRRIKHLVVGKAKQRALPGRTGGHKKVYLMQQKETPHFLEFLGPFLTRNYPKGDSGGVPHRSPPRASPCPMTAVQFPGSLLHAPCCTFLMAPSSVPM